MSDFPPPIPQPAAPPPYGNEPNQHKAIIALIEQVIAEDIRDEPYLIAVEVAGRLEDAGYLVGVARG